MVPISKTPSNPHFLAIVNPKSGTGNAVITLTKIVLPEWEKKGCTYEVLITKRQHQAIDYIKNHRNIQNFDGIIAIGGDGTLAEVITGLVNNTLLSKNEKIPVSLIPAGSGNGVTASLLHEAKLPFSIQEAAKMTTSGCIKQMDVIKIIQNKNKTVSTLGISMGGIAKLDLESERFRFLGKYRFLMGAIKTIWDNIVFPAKLTFFEEIEGRQPQKTVISKEFSILLILNTSHCASNAHTAPGAKVDDGYAHIITIGKVSRLKLLQILLKMESGSYVNDPCVMRFKTKEFTLESMQVGTPITVDGEAASTDPIAGRVQHAALKVFSYPQTNQSAKRKT